MAYKQTLLFLPGVAIFIEFCVGKSKGAASSILYIIQNVFYCRAGQRCHDVVSGSQTFLSSSPKNAMGK